MIAKRANIVSYAALRHKLVRPRTDIVNMVSLGTDIWEMGFDTSLSDAIFCGAHLANPKRKLAIWFEGGSQACGIETWKWYFVVNNRLFRRITYKDIGKHARSGLIVKRDGLLLLYLTPMKIRKGDKKRIMNSVRHLLVRTAGGDDEG